MGTARQDRKTRGGRAGRAPSWLARNVVVLGAVSLLNDASSEMVVPLLPHFLTVTLGAGALALGWIEGLADAASSILKLVSGRWADRLGRNRPLVLAGYGLSVAVRPLIALASATWHVLAVRLVDRMGKGIRTSPRDALLAGSVPARSRGAAFGFHRGMDHAGAVLGPLLAAAFLAWVSRDLRELFWLTAVPGAVAVLVLGLGVREAGRSQDRARSAERDAVSPDVGTAEKPTPGGRRSPRLARFLLPLGLFTLGNASDVFLLLKAGGERAPLETLPLLWVGLHVVKATTSVPGGYVADRLGRRRVIAAGWVVYAAVYAGFAFAQSQAAVWGLFLTYGLYHGLTEGAERALIAELAPPRRRGTAFGWYYVTLGFLTLAASVLFGALWQVFGSRVAFLTSAALAVLAVLLLALFAPPREREAGG